MKRPAVLMTDPEHYAVKFGQNPHTRTDEGALKSVDASAARRQWQRYVDTLIDHGVDVYVTRAKPDLTGMVFAANAGFIDRRLDDVPVGEKTFYVSHFTVEHRRDEEPLFESFMRQFGFQIGAYDSDLLFEGEADAFPIGDPLEPQWVFTYGFRSDPAVRDWLFEETG
jgi:N-dimethylarginine dimethylaminohydrolase